MEGSIKHQKWWALVRFPNENNTIKTLAAVEITHGMVAPGVECVFRPQDIQDFNNVQPYRIRTSCEAADKLPHSYFCQIYKLSESRNELIALTAPGAKRLHWTKISNFPEDPESSEEPNVLPGLGQMHPVQRERTIMKQLNSENQNNLLDEALHHISTNNHLGAPASTPTTPLEVSYAQEIQRLKGELQRQQEELQEEKRRNSSPVVSDNVISLLKAELTEFLKEKMTAMVEESKTMATDLLESHCAGLKDEIDKLRSAMSATGTATASSANSEHSAASYVSLPCGLKVKAAFEHRFETCRDHKDFEYVLLQACFDNPEEMRMKGAAKNKLNSDWLATAGAFYSQWLAKRPEYSEVDRVKLVTGLGTSLAKSNRNRAARGVNLAMKTARDAGLCPKEAKEAYEAEQARLRQSGQKRKTGGGRPTSRKRSNTTSSDTSETATPATIPSTTTTTTTTTTTNSIANANAIAIAKANAADPSTSSYQYSGWNSVPNDLIPPGPSGPSALQQSGPWTGYVEDLIG